MFVSDEQEKMMTVISEVMTRDVTVVCPADSVQHAAQTMAQWNVGILPVCDGTRLVGMVTDRDITLRSTAAGKAPDTARVSEVMSDKVYWLFEDQRVGEALQEMGDMQIRRIPVVNRNMELVGIVALGDLATRDQTNVQDALEEISFPSEPVRQENRSDGSTCQNPTGGTQTGR
jgi:CBS domain-containing protein